MSAQALSRCQRNDAIDGTHFDAFRLVKISDALNASVRIDLVDIFAGVN
jgi:hypothetical protein